MSVMTNAIACLLALASSMFLWKAPLKFFKEFGHIFLFLMVYFIFSYFSIGQENVAMETLPFRMLALTLCCSTVSLPNKRRRYFILAQLLWLWIEFFGGISLYYRGFDMPWTRISALGVTTVGSCALSYINRGVEFCLMVYWIAIWMFF